MRPCAYKVKKPAAPGSNHYCPGGRLFSPYSPWVFPFIRQSYRVTSLRITQFKTFFNCFSIFRQKNSSKLQRRIERLRHLKFRCALAAVIYWVIATQPVRGLTVNSNYPLHFTPSCELQQHSAHRTSCDGQSALLVDFTLWYSIPLPDNVCRKQVFSRGCCLFSPFEKIFLPCE